MNDRNLSSVKRSSALLWIGLFLLLFGSAFAFAGYYSLKTEQEYEANGRTATGTILGKRIEERWENDSSTENRSRTKRIHYYINYEFSPPETGTTESESSVSYKTYDEAEQGKPIEIQYLPSDPSNNRVAKNPEYVVAIVFIGIGSLVILAASFLLRFEFGARATNRRLMEEGMSAEAIIQSVEPGNVSINDVAQWRIGYSFRDMRGQEVSGMTSHMSPAKAREWNVGDKGSVRYDRDNSKVNLWVGRSI